MFKAVMMLKKFFWLTPGISLLLVACGGGGSQPVVAPVPTEPTLPTTEIPPPTPEPLAALDVALREVIEQQKLDGIPDSPQALIAVNEPLAQLGKQLFFSKALSGDTDTACVSCHHPLLGMGDGLSLSIGVGAERPDVLGKGRRHAAEAAFFDGGPTITRNAPTLFNIAFWQQTLFHDGRVQRLPNGSISTPDSGFKRADPKAGNTLIATQVRFPVASNDEMRGFQFLPKASRETIRQALIDRLVTQQIPNTWLQLFQQVFKSNDDAKTLITFDNIMLALDAYQRSLNFIDSPWSHYVRGDIQAIEEKQKKGALLFFRSVENGGADCASCHRGDFMTDEQFYVLAIPQIGRGTGNGDTVDDDLGRFLISADLQDKFAFRTPSLLNVAATHPYGHDGAYPTLEGIVRHHLDPAGAIRRYDFTLSTLDPGIRNMNAERNTLAALAQLRHHREIGRKTVQDIALDDVQIEQLLAFLQSLTDPCVINRDCLASWIADNNVTGADNLQLNALNNEGNPL